MSLINKATADSDRKAQITGRIIQTIEEYSKAFKVPCPLKVLSAKYGKALKGLGGLPEVLDEMKNEGLIELYLNRTGSKVVCIPGQGIEVKEAVKL